MWGATEVTNKFSKKSDKKANANENGNNLGWFTPQ